MQKIVNVNKQMVLDQYYSVRGIVADSKGKYSVVDELILDRKPTEEDIVEFLSTGKYDFCSVLENYKLEEVGV